MKKLIVANWKMLPATWGEAEQLLNALDEHVRGLERTDNFELVVCPPFVFLEEVVKLLGQGILVQTAQLGAQDVAERDEGALTGEVSAAQLVALGVRYAIAGHSERRYKLGESDAVVNAKIRRMLEHGLTPIVCLGERTKGDDWRAELTGQTRETLKGLSAGQIAACILAYEPVWAISTNPDAKPDTPASAVQSMQLIRQTLDDHFGVAHPTFLYGGSVTPANAQQFLERPEVRGVLVGGASVRAGDFSDILTIAAGLH